VNRPAIGKQGETSVLEGSDKTIKDPDAPFDIRQSDHDSTFTASNAPMVPFASGVASRSSRAVAIIVG
jgi:hypothetical protein